MQFDEIQRRAREVFRQEAGDLLAELESALLDIEKTPEEHALIDRAFRALHTLKGSGATSGFPELSTFLHHVEDVFNAARDGRVPVSSALVDLTLEVSDAVQRYLAAPPETAPAVLTDAAPIVDRLLALLPEVGADLRAALGSSDSLAKNGDATAETRAKASGREAPPTTPTAYRIRFTPAPEFFQRGADPAMFLDDLRSFGPCEIECVTDRVPALDDLDPELCYLSWSVDLVTERDPAALRDVFAFVDDACTVEIVPRAANNPVVWRVEFEITTQSLAAPGLVPGLWRELETLGTVRVVVAPSADRACAGRWVIDVATTASEDDLAAAFLFAVDAHPSIAPVTVEPMGSSAPVTSAILSAGDNLRPDVARERATYKTPSAGASGEAAKHDVLKVSADKIDRLVNLVGELVILRSQVSNACAQLGEVPPVLRSAAEGIERLSAELREVVLNVRMMPVRESFTKFKRIVRDLSRDLGKEVELVVEGEETEMDKSMLEQLNDPLLHIIRNALDHGIEPPAAREQAGKPRAGRLRLTAVQQGDRVCVTVADDGHGLDPSAIRAKAIAKGLLAPTATPTEAELFQLVFLPGFSTAKTVSETSGRGVGMDVVKKRIELMRGSVTLTSKPGSGTELVLSLPLTLAIIEGLMVDVGGERYVLPLSLVREIVERPVLRNRTAPNIIELRGQAVAVVTLRDAFGLTPSSETVERIVIAEIDGHAVGIAVDAVLGSHQTVLKPLGWAARHVRLFSGATITGDGHVALILDVNALLVPADATGAHPIAV